MVARTKRKWTAKAVLGVAAVAAVGILSASALASVDPTTGSTSSEPPAADTTGAPSSSDTTGAPSSGDTTDTTTSGDSTDTTSADPNSSSPELASETVGDTSVALYLVKFLAGTSAAAQADAIAAAGGTDVSSIGPLRLHSVSFPADPQY